MEIVDVTSAPVRAERVLADMFAARKRVFIDLLGWELPIHDERFEVDQFDNAKAGTAAPWATRLYPGTHQSDIASLDHLGEPVVAECGPGDCQSAFNRDPLSARKRDPLAEMLGG